MPPRSFLIGGTSYSFKNPKRFLNFQKGLVLQIFQDKAMMIFSKYLCRVCGYAGMKPRPRLKRFTADSLQRLIIIRAFENNNWKKRIRPKCYLLLALLVVAPFLQNVGVFYLQIMISIRILYSAVVFVMNKQAAFLTTMLQQITGLETSPYIKDLPNQWVTCDGRTVISCADHFCEKESESEKNSSKSVCNSKSQLCRQKLPTDCVGLLYTARFLGKTHVSI